MPSSGLTLRERVERRLLKTNGGKGCWLWLGAHKPNGYAQIAVKTGDGSWKVAYVHRLMFEWHKRAIPSGRELDHLCRVRGCVNPDHLELVTRKENIRRGAGPRLLGSLNGQKT